MAPSSLTFDDFATVHMIPLAVFGNPPSPPHLHRHLFRKLSSETFDGGDFFTVEPCTGGRQCRLVLSAPSLDKESDVFLIDHAWTFRLPDALKQLKEIPGLAERMAALMCVDVDLESESVEDEVVGEGSLEMKFLEVIEREMERVKERGGDGVAWLELDIDDEMLSSLDLSTKFPGYVMDQEPTVELEKMMKSEPDDYDEYFVINPLPVKCTEKSTEEARNKYSQLVSKMHSEYKEAVVEKLKFKVFDEKLTFATTHASRRKRKFVMTDGKNRIALRGNRMRATPSNFGGWA